MENLNIPVVIFTDLEEGGQNTIPMKEIKNDNDYYQDSDVGFFWKMNKDEFKNGHYWVTYTSRGIIKIEREEEMEFTNRKETFKTEECVICLTEEPNILFCNCGHIPICAKCDDIDKNKKCPVCRQENTIKRKI